MNVISKPLGIKQPYTGWHTVKSNGSFIKFQGILSRVLKYEGGLKSSYDDFISTVDDFFWPMRSKHNNTDRRNVLTASCTMWDNKPVLFSKRPL